MFMLVNHHNAYDDSPTLTWFGDISGYHASLSWLPGNILEDPRLNIMANPAG